MSIWRVFKERGVTTEQLTNFLPTIFLVQTKCDMPQRPFLLKKYPIKKQTTITVRKIASQRKQRN
jgi:hypothetical protein